jgi:3-hydroxyisobutyrate dehydrogenase-like beta-hydroxyacid dehydrogenase
MTMGSMISALAEGAALAEASGLDQTKLLEVNGSLSKSTPYKEYSQIKREEINI